MRRSLDYPLMLLLNGVNKTVQNGTFSRDNAFKKLWRQPSIFKSHRSEIGSIVKIKNLPNYFKIRNVKNLFYHLFKFCCKDCFHSICFRQKVGAGSKVRLRQKIWIFWISRHSASGTHCLKSKVIFPRAHVSTNGEWHAFCC